MVVHETLRPFLDRAGYLVLDGALATELERHGADLSGGLWSARLLYENPELIRSVHLDYLRAGADCIISASYQATLEAFVEQGRSPEEASALLRRSVEICHEARGAFLSERTPGEDRPKPLIAASIGPYGAAQADGSEYTGAYDLDEEGLVAFHSRRTEILADCRADLLACETIPSGIETRALRRVLSRLDDVRAWVSFSCKDQCSLADGSPLVDAVRCVEDLPQVIAVGINCTPPHLIPALIEATRTATEKPIVVYPNSGESWDAKRQSWNSDADDSALEEGAIPWFESGARLIGGCCRTTPQQIQALRRVLDRNVSHGSIRP